MVAAAAAVCAVMFAGIESGQVIVIVLLADAAVVVLLAGAAVVAGVESGQVVVLLAGWLAVHAGFVFGLVVGLIAGLVGSVRLCLSLYSEAGQGVFDFLL